MSLQDKLSKEWSYQDWAPILLLSLLFVAGVFFYCDDFEPSETFTAYNEKRILDFKTQLLDQQLSIVILGNSVSKHGFYAEEKLGSVLSEKLGKEVKVLTLYRNSGVYYDYKGLSQTLVQLKPSLIVIQKDLLGTCYGNYRRTHYALKYWYWKFFGVGAWAMDERDLVEDQFVREPPKVFDSNKVSAKVGIFFHRFLSIGKYEFSIDNRSRRELDDFYSVATQAKIPFLFVDIPRSKQVSLYVFKDLPREQKYEILYQEPQEDEFFNDAYHLNAEGRKVSSLWLSEQVVKCLGGRL